MQRVKEPSIPSERYADAVFASVDHDEIMERIGGGFETEVFCTEDRRYLVKLKGERGSDRAGALRQAQAMRAIADQLVAGLGPEHSLPSGYMLAEDSAGKVHVLVIQPFLQHARPLAQVDLAALPAAERAALVGQLQQIRRRGPAL